MPWVLDHIAEISFEENASACDMSTDAGTVVLSRLSSKSNSNWEDDATLEHIQDQQGSCLLKQTLQQFPKPCNGEVQQPRHQPCSEQRGHNSRRPWIIFCGVKASACGLYEKQAQEPLHFSGSVHFTRWLFAQRRGAVTPWAILVTSWREAKPCALAIAAVRTGRCEGLRLDERRPPLRKCTGTVVPGQPVNVAVSGMIVMLAAKERTLKAADWINYQASHTTKLPTYVTSAEAPGLRTPFAKVIHELQLTQDEEHLVKPNDLAEAETISPDQPRHVQLAAYAPAKVLPASPMKLPHFKAVPAPIRIEVNPWYSKGRLLSP